MRKQKIFAGDHMVTEAVWGKGLHACWMWVRELASHVGTKEWEHARHVGTSTRKHARYFGVCEYANRQGRLARERVRTQGTLTCKSFLKVTLIYQIIPRHKFSRFSKFTSYYLWLSDAIWQRISSVNQWDELLYLGYHSLWSGDLPENVWFPKILSLRTFLNFCGKALEKLLFAKIKFYFTAWWLQNTR